MLAGHLLVSLVDFRSELAACRPSSASLMSFVRPRWPSDRRPGVDGFRPCPRLRPEPTELMTFWRSSRWYDEAVSAYGERSSIPSSSGQALGVSRAHVLSVRPAGFHPAWPTSRSRLYCSRVGPFSPACSMVSRLYPVQDDQVRGVFHLGNALHLYLAWPCACADDGEDNLDRFVLSLAATSWENFCMPGLFQHVPVTLNAFIVRPLASLCKRWGLKAHRPPIKDMPEYLFSPQAISGALSMLDVNSCWPSEGPSGRKLTTLAPS